ncbi:AbrB/MazE/SpoVT family DNA-binding domain-containing protein [Candidatus Woesearchaeota archaeon]|nr:AbrB/MazE/SpoVT family DNA-binding domain-containing protein [Candidatus Woesearchaeota archaeon]
MTTLTQKSQVTIPKQFRLAVGLGPGDEVEFGIKDDGLIVRKKARRLPFERWKGVIKGYDSKKFREEFR